jgi:hypothetical protein
MERQGWASSVFNFVMSYYMMKEKTKRDGRLLPLWSQREHSF